MINRGSVEGPLEKDLLISSASVLALSFAFTIIDKIHKYNFVEKPLNKILYATEQVTNGDFTVQIPVNDTKKTNEYDLIFDNFNKMVTELNNTETLKLDFISNISHELKTPLSVISNYSVLLQSDDISDEERAEYSRHIYYTTKDLSGLIENILKLGKLENQELLPNSRTFNLSESVIQCLLKYTDDCESKNIDLDIDIDENIIIQSDEELLKIVWHNLFSNATKFTDNGGKIKISLKQDNDTIIFKIKDNGCGIPADVGNRIFDKFYQADTSHTGKGNGLGLALAKRVIDILNGEITYDSTLGEGTCFNVKINNY